MPSFGGLVRDVTALARAVPGVRFAERQLRGVERVAMRELSARIEEATPPPPAPEHNGHPQSPAERLDELLRRSMHQTPDESNASLVEVVLGSIVPDEARIISALSDGSSYPLVHVDAGRGAKRVLSNASSVGRAAGVALPDRVPAYVSHLEQLGLVEIGPQDKSMPDEYEILLTDHTVRRARDRAGDQRVRFAKHTVRISDLGLEFWEDVPAMTLAFLEFEEPWYIYVSMPLIAAFVGYITKLLAVEMIFRPLEFKGIKPWFGWQGMVPRRAAKMAGIAVDSVMSGLLEPRELFERLDPDELLKQIEEPLEASINEITEEVMSEFNPGIWEAMPMVARRQLTSRVKGRMPETSRRLLAMLQDNVDQVFDIKHMVVTNLVRDKSLLVRMFRDTAHKALKFIVKAGTIFAFYVGLVQVAVFILTGSHLVLPLFGLIVGGLTDWIALRMIFRPVERGRVLGIFPWQGLFHKLRDEVTEDYGGLLAKEILTPQAIIDSLLNGPMSDKLYEMVEQEVKAVIDAQTGIARPFVAIAIGGRKYQDMKKRIAEIVIAKMPETLEQVQDYAFEAMDVDTLIVERMKLMSSSQYEELLRPAFREDENKVVAVGAILGFVVGELQAQLLL